MAPGNHESAGKRRRAKARHGNRWLRTILVECGHAAGRTRDTALAAIYRRMIIRAGRKTLIGSWAPAISNSAAPNSSSAAASTSSEISASRPP
jgi:Transposase IS116/IS110/IS902 family